MVDWATAILGKNVKVRTTEVEAGAEPRTYTVRPSGVTKLNGSPIACHTLPYAYAIHYCHRLHDTDAYEVSTVREDDGVEMVAVAVCHKDTWAWSPEHIGFKVLNVESGTEPVCHFLPHGNLVWVASDATPLQPVAF